MGLTSADFVSKDMVVHLGFSPNRIDLMTSISGLDFQECFDSKIEVTLGRNKVNLLSLEHLIVNKKAFGRLKDLADLEMIKNISRSSM
ncbi:MAG: hypothetical protein WCK13_13470 [Ignavibacteriota bacterium]